MDAEHRSRPHPRKTPRLTQPLTPEGLGEAFRDCADFTRRTLWVGGRTDAELTLCFLEGMVRAERVSDNLLRPLATGGALRAAAPGEWEELLLHGAQFSPGAHRCRSVDEAADDLTRGWCVLFLPGGAAVGLFAASEEKRAVGEPDDEPGVKGARDSFTESVRTNTALVRRRIRAPEVRIREQTVGRQTLTAVDLIWIDGIADPDTVAAVWDRLAAMDVDGIRTAGDLEEYVAGGTATAFPLIAATQRPDWFCSGLLEGRVGLLCDGQPLGWLLPGTVSLFFRTEQDRAQHWLVATALRALRLGCMAATVLLPALYTAVVTFHPEVLPLKLALSIARAKREVPFPTGLEVMILLLCFEILQEAGLRLPGPFGQTVSILGGLVVGSAAVEARIVSPAVLIVVAGAGIAGYTAPSQDFANALRLWRFGLAALSAVGGLLGFALGLAALVGHLATLESVGVPYLGALAAPTGDAGVVRRPLRQQKLRPGILRPANRRERR